MPEGTAEFFERLGRTGHQPLLEKATGRIRFELVNGKQTERWLVAIDEGDIAVSRKSGQTDCSVRSSKALFDDIVAGRENALAAVLRGALEVDGDPELLMLFQRILPGPPANGSAS
jgi:putative sterol carrier protein